MLSKNKDLTHITMRTPLPLLVIALVASACTFMQPGTMVRDDVYDIPDRTAFASVGGTNPASDGVPEGFEEDYYDPNTSEAQYDTRSYNDIAYNDPQYYNYDRFRFNVGIGYSTWGPSYGMGMGMGMGSGWPGMYGDPWDPYWNNSWMSGYGAWGNPWYGGGWNTGMSMNWGYPYGGYNPYYGGYNPYYGGYNPYGYPYGPGCCYTCVGTGSGSGLYQHRPSFGGGRTGGGNNTLAPRPDQYRQNNTLRPSTGTMDRTRDAVRTITRPTTTPATPQRNPVQRNERARPSDGQPRIVPGGGSRMERPAGGGSNGGSTGGGNGGGSRPSNGGGRR